MEEMKRAIHVKGVMLKALLVLITGYASYRFIVYVLVPFYSLSDSTLLTFAAGDSVADFLTLAGIM